MDSDICRTCLLRHPSALVPLADSRNDTPILDMLAGLCGVHFRQSPQLSDAICERCLTKLEVAHAVGQEFRDREMLLRSVWGTEGWLVLLEEYRVGDREEPRSERLLGSLIAGLGQQERGAEEIVEEKEETVVPAPPSESVVKEELIIEDKLNTPCEDKPGDQQDGGEFVPEEELDVKLLKRYRCKECHRPFLNLNAYRNHLRKHEQIRQHWLRTCSQEQKRTCAYCKREFPESISFQRHVAWHKRRGLRCCKTCGEHHATAESLKNHVCPYASGKRAKPERLLFRCDECGKRFLSKKHYQVHLERHENLRNGTFKCDVCSKCLATKFLLRKHMSEHRGSPEYSKECEECGQVLTTPNAYQCHKHRHKKDQNGSFHCAKCKKNFATPARLASHRFRVHKGLPVYSRECEECGQVLTSVNAYQCHVYRHKKDQNGSFHCAKCEKNFATLARLANHKCDAQDPANEAEISVEPALKEEPITEDEPSSSGQPSNELLFFEENSLATVKDEPLEENDCELEVPPAKSPVSTQGNNGQFECGECGKRFSRENHYRSHLEKHENIRKGTFQCDICQQFLGGQRDLWNHKRNSHKEMPKWMQNCAECGRVFSSENSYHCHMTRHRNVQSGRYRCEACGKCMSHHSEFKRHKCTAQRENK
uniref:Zinc finger protein 564 n=1 Tax=Culex pipiens TaxID=7175 RepID=A0A8D8I7B5_CULPI